MSISEHMTFDSVSFSRDGFKLHVKSPVIWGNTGSALWPLCYLHRPKWMSDDDWNNFLDRFDFTIKKEQS